MVEIEICESSINKICDKLMSMELKNYDWNGPQFLMDNDIEKIIQFFFVGNAINFRFWYTRYNERYKYGEYDGSTAMWFFLKNNIRLINSNYISALEIDTEPGLIEMPMGVERIIALREAGNQLIKNFQGNAINLCEHCNWNAPKIINTITEYFHTWKDENRNIMFNKRAQLFVSMVHGRLGGKSKITDINKLTCLADYQLPKVLKYLGVLKYSKILEHKIKSQIIINSGSDDEFIIRYSTIKAVDLLCNELKRRKIDINPVQLDYNLWKLSRDINQPHHLTVTMAY